MTLIEVLVYYKRLVAEQGRKVANLWLDDVCDATCIQHVRASVSEVGNFIDAEGYEFNP